MKIPVTNNSAMSIYVGSAVIPPGETRHFELEDVPLHLQPAPVEEVAVEVEADPLAELLEGNVTSVVAALDDMTLADIERMGDLEQAGQARKGVLSAVAEALLARAEAAGENG